MKFKIFISILAFPISLIGQNLINNGSFEEFNNCPDDYSQQYYMPYVKCWDSPNAGTPDYFNECSDKCGVPLNWIGNASAYNGNAYMGIIACMQQIDRKQIAYREYIRIKLNDTLEAGKKYYASMQTRLGLSCNVSCNGVGMYFSHDKLTTSRKINYPFVPQVMHINNDIIDNKSEWTKICGTFKAEGDETYLLIGNFLSNQEMKYRHLDENLIQTQQTIPSAYYLIDNVEVFAYHDSLINTCSLLESETTKEFKGHIKRDERLVLKNLHFEINKAIIIEDSYYELNLLVSALKKNTNLKIRIHGHTDNTGGEQYNLNLSEERAIAVKGYLIEKGISKFRMSIKGFGDTVPISDNNPNKGKQLNRRVEIEVY